MVRGSAPDSSSSSSSSSYPFTLPGYHPALDDGHRLPPPHERRGLADPEAWRSERYPAASSVLVLDHHQGHGLHRYCDDAQIQHLLDVS
jgi:hypothetical protein